MLAGLVPHLTNQTLYVAIGILGATVMPHNLYLHSALVQTRRIGLSAAEKRTACRFNLIDSVVALNGALVVNAAILILAATVFFQRHIIVTEIQQAHLLLTPLLGTTLASILFGVALLASGQSSTLTGTLAGQIVMEGFLNLRMRPWLRRFITRALAVIPAIAVIYVAGDKGTYQLLLLSQVILSMQLSFAVIPLVQFTGDRKRMGEFANPGWLQVLAWTVTAVIVALNIRLVMMEVSEWLTAAGPYWMWVSVTVIPVCLFVTALLIWITFEPVLPRAIRELSRVRVRLPEAKPVQWVTPTYRRILVPLDHSNRDQETVIHAAALARAHNSKLTLLHIEEDVTSQIYGALSSTAEVESGRRYFEDLGARLREQGIDVELAIIPGNNPRDVIVQWAREHDPT